MSRWNASQSADCNLFFFYLLYSYSSTDGAQTVSAGRRGGSPAGRAGSNSNIVCKPLNSFGFAFLVEGRLT